MSGANGAPVTVTLGRREAARLLDILAQHEVVLSRVAATEADLRERNRINGWLDVCRSIRWEIEAQR